MAKSDTVRVSARNCITSREEPPLALPARPLEPRALTVGGQTNRADGREANQIRKRKRKRTKILKSYNSRS